MSRLPIVFRRLLGPALGLLALSPLASRGETAATPPVVALPPFMVEDASAPLHWRYAKFAGNEILSLCDDATTTEFIRQLGFLDQQLDGILPAEFRFTTSLPTTHIICGDSMRDRLEKDIPAEMYLDQNGQPAAGARPAGPRPHLGVLPSLYLRDDDADTIFAILNSNFQAENQLTYLPAYMESLLQRRTPRLPAWFIDGFMSLYGQLSVVTLASTNKDDQTSFISVAKVDREQDHQDVDPTLVRLRLPPFVWISPEESRQLVRKAKLRLQGHAPVTGLFRPLKEILAGPPPPAATAHDRSAWLSEAALFARWGLDENAAGRGAPFWRFLTQASAGPVTEVEFRGCFGTDYRGMAEIMGRYVVTASTHESILGRAIPNPHPVYPRAATPAEVARIKGDWERLETVFVKKTYPALSDTYLRHAHQTLWQAYALGDSDPRLLASMGLYECDAGDDAAALPLLHAATEAGVIRPRAYFEQARILFAAGTAKPAGALGKMNAAQTAAVLEPLAAGRKQLPPLLPACELFANVWFHSEDAPSPDDLAALEGECLLFPTVSGLTLQTAILEAKAGLAAEAGRLIDRGLKNAEGDATKARFLQLRALLAPGK